MKTRRRTQLPEWKPWHSRNSIVTAILLKSKSWHYMKKDDRDNNLPSFFYFIVAEVI